MFDIVKVKASESKFSPVSKKIAAQTDNNPKHGRQEYLKITVETGVEENRITLCNRCVTIRILLLMDTLKSQNEHIGKMRNVKCVKMTEYY